ncbi:MAG: hypothetical protein H6Q67_1459 [Firmicutes bacterium]|nr:hypothetical protein [Bacillota bacterium]
MRKILLLMIAALILQIGTAFALPVIDVESQQSAFSLSNHNGDKSKDYSFTTQLNSTFAIGFQHVDWDEDTNMNDFYGQFYIDEKGQTRVIVGNRNYHSESKMLYGLAATIPLNDQWSGYAALLGVGKLHNDSPYEFEVGACYKITDTAVLNFEYRNISDGGIKKKGAGIGLTTIL